MATRRREHRRLGAHEITEVIRLLVGERPSRRLVEALFWRTGGDPRKLLVELVVAFADAPDLPATLEQLTSETLRPS